jgi:hypothetical protein
MNKIGTMCVVALMVSLFGVGCMPKMNLVESESKLLPGVIYVGSYIKHPTGMNVSRIDQYENGKCAHPGNTVKDTGIVNNAFKDSVGMAAMGGFYALGQAIRTPDEYHNSTTTNVSGTSTAGANPSNVAGAGAVAGAAAGVVNKNINLGINKQNQEQKQGLTDGNFSPICQ